jgi:hypothetical protein
LVQRLQPAHDGEQFQTVARDFRLRVRSLELA